MKYFISGVTGTLGKQLLNLLLEDGHEVIGYSRDEQKQQLLAPHSNLTLYLGDVRDKHRLLEATRGVDVIVHCAALKCVDILESNPEECIRTNIYGTENILFTQRVNKIPRVVLASTDKAVMPINVYGASKMAAERLVLRNPNNIVCRYGNVLGSRGSVLPKFVETLKTAQSVNITDIKMTRFWLPANDAAVFVYLSSRRPIGGLCIPKVKGFPVIGIAKIVAEILNIPLKAVNDVGIRPGEKLHELLRTENEGGLLDSQDQAHWFTRSELKELLTPIVEGFAA